ncbi:hypothetical protein AVEN_9749-1 [Araneus ventricosus]|uniref:Uncharacterized protein n=1 Tax=Araneus ventricosus TaxID=182803 RepID=A0A4Y2KNY2_ARAVE|nr:hypothetical protein AVEN_9749-1 [Araneus ventricosus]
MSGVTKFRALPMRVRRSSKLRGNGGTYTLSFKKSCKKKTHGGRGDLVVKASGLKVPGSKPDSTENLLYLRAWCMLNLTSGLAKEFIVWSFGEKRDRWRIDLEIDSRLDSRDRKGLRSQISARDSALVRAFLDLVELKPAFGWIAPLESCNALEHSFKGSLES